VPQIEVLGQHLLLANSRCRPEQDALVDGSRRWTYQSVAQQVESLASVLSHLGVRRFDRVGIQLPASAEQVFSLLAVAAAGGVFVPIHASLFPRQVGHIARDCQLSILITRQSLWQRLQSEATQLGDLQHVVLTDGTSSESGEPGLNEVRIHDLATLLATVHRAPSERGVDRDLAAILYTSGSTGLPKGVMLSHANLVAGATIVSDYLAVRAHDRLLAALPLSFDAGLNQLTTAFQQGATLVMQPFVLAKQIVSTLQSERITGLAGVPTLWNLLAQSQTFQQSSFPYLRYVTNTGGALQPATRTQIRRTLPSTELYLMYGLTEAFRSTYLPPAELERRGESIGKAIPNTEIFVINEQGRRCLPGESGELVHHGPTVSLGYWNQPELTARVLRPHPFPAPGNAAPPLVCYSGDLVYADEGGYLYFVGRRDDQIKTSGFRVSPMEVESVLAEHADVVQAAVVGVPDPMLGESIHAFVDRLAGRDATAEDLREFCASRLPHYMVPQQILFLERLPLTTSGKLDYAQLRSTAIDMQLNSRTSPT
jgi:acyl-CoA ligase (AMP-forming) (exosortase A-associated)